MVKETGWHNLPCEPTLAALSAACPRGWVEIHVEHHSGDSGHGGNTPQEPDTVFQLGRSWGVECADLDALRESLDSGELLDGPMMRLPHRAIAVARVTQGASGLDFTWGEGEKPVHFIGEESAMYSTPDEDAYMCGSEVRCDRCGSHVTWVDLAMSEHRLECEGEDEGAT